jgi:monomeric sarcosine oxidase
MDAEIVVVGAGAFGGWTALELVKRGCRVTLVDSWGPGHSRSSSGDETRVIRGGYGANPVYTQMVAQSLPLWKDLEARRKLQVLHQVGVLWVSNDQDEAWNGPAIEALRRYGLKLEVLTPAEGRSRWPQLSWDDITMVIFEKDGGFLLARRSCQAVWAEFLALGGTYRQAEVQPGPVRNGRMETLQLSDGSKLEASAYVFACGPWFGRVFPELFAKTLVATRQNAFYFGTPAGNDLFNETRFPAWIDNSKPRYYGIPGNEHRGFKVAEDVPGPPLDPTTDERLIDPAKLAEARRFLFKRFPQLVNAPVSETRVCQYEMTPDGHLVLDRHPEAGNVVFAGGGSGHGFKMAPAVGQIATGLLLDNAPAPAEFVFSRLAKLAGQLGERK